MLIATRVLKLRQPDGETEIPVRVYMPQQENTGSWGCRFEIGWPDRPSDRTIFGVDAMQSLVLALQMIGFETYTSGYHEANELYFDKPGEGYGFPVMAPYRDLLQGDDARFL